MENTTPPKNIADDVARLAYALPEAYKMIRRREKPRFKLDRTKFGPLFWKNVAFKLQAIGVQAAGFFEFQFRDRSLNASLYEICSDQAVEAYRLEIQTDAPQIRAEAIVKSQLEVVEELMKGRKLRDILLDLSTDVNSIIRYCLAVAAGLTDVATHLQPEAAAFLSKYPAYRSSKVLAPLFVEPPAPPEDLSRWKVRCRG